MNNKNNRRTQMTKRILRESLLEMLKTVNIQKISIRALCEKANINRSTFYKYYGSQFDLLKEMEDDLLSRIEESFNSSPNEEMRSMTAVLAFIKNNIELCEILINSNVDEEFPKKLLYLPAILNRVNIGETERQAEYIYIQDCILYGGYQMIKRWINEGCRETPEEMARILIMTFQKLRD